jgi:hypothetical protein
MKWLSLLAAAALTVLAQTPAVHNVYILPMAGGLDQYLAEQLTRGHVLEIVADPKIADAVITDRLGESFEQKMEQIHPPPDADKNKKTDTAENAVRPSFRSSAAKGTVFLVDIKSRRVLWSDYEKPLSNLNREAARIAKKLGIAFGTAKTVTG